MAAACLRALLLKEPAYGKASGYMAQWLIYAKPRSPLLLDVINLIVSRVTTDGGVLPSTRDCNESKTALEGHTRCMDGGFPVPPRNPSDSPPSIPWPVGLPWRDGRSRCSPPKRLGLGQQPHWAIALSQTHPGLGPCASRTTFVHYYTGPAVWTQAVVDRFLSPAARSPQGTWCNLQEDAKKLWRDREELSSQHGLCIADQQMSFCPTCSTEYGHRIASRQFYTKVKMGNTRATRAGSGRSTAFETRPAAQHPSALLR